MDIECLYEDDSFFVLNKPSGLLIHRGWGVAEVALVDFARSRTVNGAAHPINRLDRGASGAVIFAKSPELASIMQTGTCHKSYLALVRGELRANLDIDYPISRNEDGPKVPSRTLVESIGVAETEPRHVSLVRAQPLTGRLHQIRRHLKHANYPLIGDVRYGHGNINHAFRDKYGLARLALHACEWSLRHPHSGELISGIVQLPVDLVDPLTRMGFALEPDRLYSSTSPRFD